MNVYRGTHVDCLSSSSNHVHCFFASSTKGGSGFNGTFSKADIQEKT